MERTQLRPYGHEGRARPSRARVYDAPGCVTGLCARRLGRASPGHRLSLRGKLNGSSGSAPRADFAMRGFAISPLILLRIASAASLSNVLLIMIDDYTLLHSRMVNLAHVPMLLDTRRMNLGATLTTGLGLRRTRILSAGDLPCSPSAARRLRDLYRNISAPSRT